MKNLTTELDLTLKVYFTTPTQTLPIGVVRFLPTEVVLLPTNDLKEAAKKYHNLKIIDWYAYSKDHARFRSTCWLLRTCFLNT